MRGDASPKCFLASVRPPNPLQTTTITRINSAGRQICEDLVATEEPLEIRVAGQALAVVMRTPGHDRELATGFLLTEGVLQRRDDLLDLVYCRPLDGTPRDNIIEAVLAPGLAVDLERLTRHVFSASSCGICSKASIDAIRTRYAPLAASFAPRAAVLARLPAALAEQQAGFSRTGGVQGAALFTADGTLLVAREDVGRHNAVDKVLGHAFLAGSLSQREPGAPYPAAAGASVGCILLVSGRVSFEIVQKALAAGVPCLAAISAPTSAAIALAAEAGQTLVGFLRAETDGDPATRFNLYAGSVADR